METLHEEYLSFLCHALAKATCAAVRLYRGEECLYYYSVYHLHPDPALPFLPQLLDESHRAGVFTTPLQQFYGFLTLRNGDRVIIGPSRPENPEPRLLEEQLFLLRVGPEDKAAYLHTLSCFPVISAERVGWLMTFLASVLEQKAFPMERLYINVRPEEHRSDIQTSYLKTREEELWQTDAQLVDQGQQFEKLVLSYVRQGEPDRLRELFNAPPPMLAGKMSSDTLRQIKNTGICAAAIACRAAVEGGLDSQTAYRMSDLYIQKIELLQDVASLEKLRFDILIDYAGEVRRVRYRVPPSGSGQAGDIFTACAEYVARNIYSPVRVEDIAGALGYSRSYLSSRFRQQTGMTLTRYILQEKVFEAQRMLEFTDESLLDIANLFSFSSQSHFQSAFKKIAGETPMAYRKRIK